LRNLLVSSSRVKESLKKMFHGLLHLQMKVLCSFKMLGIITPSA